MFLKMRSLLPAAVLESLFIFAGPESSAFGLVPRRGYNSPL